MSQHSRLASQWPANELNEVNSSLINIFGGSMLIKPEYKARKEVTVQLSKAVADENNCGSITAAQKAG
jgi:hypothetical protein